MIVFLSSCSATASKTVYSHVPPFTLTDQTGATFDSATLANKVWIADFMFTNCTGPCPRMSAQMREVQTALASEPDVRLVSLTIDPERDTPEVMARYALRYDATPGKWFFLTGPRDTLQFLDKKVFMLGDVDASLQHSTRFVLVDRQSDVRGYYSTPEPDAIPRLIADAKKLVKERP